MTDDVTDEDDISTIDSLRALALEHGFDYRDADSSLVDRWGAPPFTELGHRRALDVVTGERNGFDVVAFRFVVGERERTGNAVAGYGGGLSLRLPERLQAYLVVAAALPGPLPRFSLVPHEDAVDEVPFGYGFECEDPDLAERYEVYAADPETAGAVLHLDAVTAIREHRTVDWRIEGRDLIAVDPLGEDERSVSDVLATIDALTTIARGIPSDTYSRFKAPSGYPPPA